MATSGTERSDNLELFLAVKRGDIDAVAQILDRRPELVNAEEEWTAEEAYEAQILYANEATALVRASERDDLAMVRFLVDRGADVNQVCGCEEAESPLWLAVTTRSTDMARYLVEIGANVNCPAFAGHFPLHVAAMRGWDDLVELLLGAGADVSVHDQGGRTPLDWALRNGNGSVVRLLEAAGARATAAAETDPRPAAPATRRADLLETGIKTLDFFAPIRHGDLVRWDPGRQCFHLPMLTEMTRTLLGSGYESAVWAGFEDDFINRRELTHALTELGSRDMVTLMLADRGVSPEARREHLARVGRHVEELRARGRVLLVLFQDAGQVSDPETAFPRMNRRGDHAVTAICATPVRFPDRPLEPVELRPPLHVRVAHEMLKVGDRQFPSVDGRLTVSDNLTAEDAGAEHVRLVAGARDLFERYLRVDPTLQFPKLETLPEDERGTATRAQRLHAYLTQPFWVAEPFTGMPGASVPVGETLRGVSRILEGELDAVPLWEIWYRGALD